MSEPLLRVDRLSKSFGSLLVLNELSFSLNAGEVLGVVGRRGAGKQTLLNILSGVSEPSSGSIIIEGRPVSFLSPDDAFRQGIEKVNQVPRLTDQLDVLHNIFLGHEICWPPRFGFPRWVVMSRIARDLLLEFDLPASLLNESTRNLSDEQRQVLGIVRALCHPTRLLLMDDPFAALSYQRQQILLDRIRQLTGQGVAVIITSDNLKFLFSITDRILVLYEGNIASERRTADCTPKDIVELIVGNRDKEQVTPIIWALESYQTAQRETEKLRKVQVTLEKNLEVQDSLNRQLVERLHDQVEALDQLNAALQATQRRLMTEREGERKTLARELHDQVIQDLLSFNYRLEEVESNELSAAQSLELAGIRSGIRQVVGDLRQLCSDLRPPTIDSQGLNAAIQSFAYEWAERNDINLKLEIDEVFGRLPEAIELSVFRIVQEGLNNVRKHASAKNVALTLKRTSTASLRMVMIDDGQGFKGSPNLVRLSTMKHFGLISISERVALLGGTMKIESPPDGGVLLQVEIPSPYPSL